MYVGQLPSRARLFRIFGLVPPPQATAPVETWLHHYHICLFVGLATTGGSLIVNRLRLESDA